MNWRVKIKIDFVNRDITYDKLENRVILVFFGFDPNKKDKIPSEGRKVICNWDGVEP